MQKTKVGIVFGGKSGEYEVSLNSAYNVINAIDPMKYDVTKIGIDLNGTWYIFNGDTEKIKDNTWINDSEHLNSEFSLFNDIQIKEIDIFFPVLHGTFGEDGTIQGLFEMLDKPYVGCGVLASSALMDKEIAKIIFNSVNIPTAKGMSIYKSECIDKIEEISNTIASKFDMPIFIKPANMGSSVGISKATNLKELNHALIEAFKYDEKVLIEEFINGKEIEVAVLGNDTPKASIAGEIIPCNDFYDYEAKYLSDNSSKTLIPANISEENMTKIREYAITAFKASNCSGLSRVDFFLTADNKIYLNEINTLPGFTNISMYPKLWNYSGLNYSSLIDEIIRLGFERASNKKQLSYKKI